MLGQVRREAASTQHGEMLEEEGTQVESGQAVCCGVWAETMPTSLGRQDEVWLESWGTPGV